MYYTTLHAPFRYWRRKLLEDIKKNIFLSTSLGETALLSEFILAYSNDFILFQAVWDEACGILGQPLRVGLRRQRVLTTKSTINKLRHRVNYRETASQSQL